MLLVNVHKSLLDSSLKYSEVKVFLKQKANVVMVYKSITTSNNDTIHLSNNHLIYSRKTSTETFSPLQVYFMKFDLWDLHNRMSQLIMYSVPHTCMFEFKFISVICTKYLQNKTHYFSDMQNMYQLAMKCWLFTTIQNWPLQKLLIHLTSICKVLFYLCNFLSLLQ